MRRITSLAVMLACGLAFNACSDPMAKYTKGQTKEAGFVQAAAKGDLDAVNAFLESVLGGLDAGVVVLDNELRIQAWNGAAYDLWGLRGEEVVGQHFLNLDIGLPTEQLRRPIRDALAGNADGVVRVDALNRRGRAITVAVRFAPLRVDGGPLRGAILMMEADAE